MIAGCVRRSVNGCQSLCNSTSGCKAFEIDHAGKSCAMLSGAPKGVLDSTRDTYVRVPETVDYEWTGTYNGEYRNASFQCFISMRLIN